MLDLFTATWFGIVGACVGSFLNVVAYRMPRRMSVVWKPSHCPQCGHDIRARDNLPVLGWMLLGGRCRDCGAPISPRYAIVEAVMGGAFFALAYAELISGGANLPLGPLAAPAGAWYTVWNPAWPLLAAFAFHATLLSLLVAAALIALDDEVAPRRLILFAMVVIGMATVRWRGDPAHSIPAAGGPHAAIEAALGFIAGTFIALVASQIVPHREIGERERRRRNLTLALGTTGGFLGLGPLATILAVAGVGTFAICTARRTPHDFARLLPASMVPAALLHIAFWKHMPL
ncbi:MAG TPA: prepilin peptidase [Lacipirellulaceae bacterium]|nr:prepilin peptidase [Lacipirellulaceae bacterium]